MFDLKIMRKNGSRLISINQYRLTDLFLFAVILLFFDLITYYAPQLFPGGAIYSFCLTVPITLLIMIRWGWQSVFFAVGDGVLLSLLNNPSSWQSYISYAAGNALMMVLLLAVKFIGKDKLIGRWYTAACFVIVGWALANFGVTCIQAMFGYNFGEVAAANFGFGINGVLALAMGLVIVLVLRKLDGMMEDQKAYIKRVNGEQKRERGEISEDLMELDDESLSILNRDNDLY